MHEPSLPARDRRPAADVVADWAAGGFALGAAAGVAIGIANGLVLGAVMLGGALAIVAGTAGALVALVRLALRRAWAILVTDR